MLKYLTSKKKRKKDLFLTQNGSYYPDFLVFN